MSFLDNSGVSRIWNKIVSKIESHNTDSTAHSNRLLPAIEQGRQTINYKKRWNRRVEKYGRDFTEKVLPGYFVHDISKGGFDYPIIIDGMI